MQCIDQLFLFVLNYKVNCISNAFHVNEYSSIWCEFNRGMCSIYVLMLLQILSPTPGWGPSAGPQPPLLTNLTEKGAAHLPPLTFLTLPPKIYHGKPWTILNRYWSLYRDHPINLPPLPFIRFHLSFSDMEMHFVDSTQSTKSLKHELGLI